MINSNLKSVAIIKKETDENISDIRAVLDVMDGEIEGTIEVLKRFKTQGHINIKKLLENNYSFGPPLTLNRIEKAEEKLGYRLPGFYKNMLLSNNGLQIEDGCFPVRQPNSWSNDHVCVTEIFGINTYHGFSLEECNSNKHFQEWGYPNIGLVIGDTPASGHSVIMLDYTSISEHNEPAVVFIDTARRHHKAKTIKLADTLNQFMRGLVSDDNFEIGNA